MIFVLKDGQIVAHGSHEQMMKDRGLYAELASSSDVHADLSPVQHAGNADPHGSTDYLD